MGEEGEQEEVQHFQNAFNVLKKPIFFLLYCVFIRVTEVLKHTYVCTIQGCKSVSVLQSLFIAEIWRNRFPTTTAPMLMTVTWVKQVV